MGDVDGMLPAWAVELTRQVAILNEKIPTHIDWVERNIKDHEKRLRDLEAIHLDGLPEKVDHLEQTQDQSSWLPRMFVGLGSALSGVIATLIVTALINHQ